MTITYRGVGLRSGSVSFDVTMTPADLRAIDAALPTPSRMIRINLAAGQRWPDNVKRGRPVSLDIQGMRLIGKVRFRRLNTVVIDTYPDNKVPIGDLLQSVRLTGET